LCKLTHNDSHRAVQGNSTSPIFVLFDFLLVNNTKLCFISHNFWIFSVKWSNYRFGDWSLYFTPSFGWIPEKFSLKN